MLNQFSRTELLIGKEGLEKLTKSRVAVFGIGGVGGYVVEALSRSGVGTIDIIDDDKICVTNINRQIYATRKSIGKDKVEVAKERILDINNECIVNAHKVLFSKENSSEFDFTKYDYVVDAIDMVSAKIEMILKAKESNTPIISCMGAGNKMDPTKFVIDDISKTKYCPLAKIMRKELKKRGIEKGLKVLYSTEIPLVPIENDETSCKHNCVCPPGTKRKCSIRRQVPGSNAFVPSVAGLIIASEVIKDLLKK